MERPSRTGLRRRHPRPRRRNRHRPHRTSRHYIYILAFVSSALGVLKLASILVLAFSNFTQGHYCHLATPSDQNDHFII